jgi:hypothetical protein
MKIISVYFIKVRMSANYNKVISKLFSFPLHLQEWIPFCPL